ncbi:MAG: hypothetical protein KJP23_17390, partial [Deltaproteobacteria bacterium]|nr:hypothetical protein [Deltaproteobacteria bacterium]
MQLYLEQENYVAGLKYLYKAAKAGYKKAYEEIGIILNMVRAGVIAHPSEWIFGGYREIHEPYRKSCIYLFIFLPNQF